MLKKESQHSVLCTTTCIPRPVCDLWKQSWRTDHGERRHSSLQSELTSDWGKTDCSPRARGTVLRNKNFVLLWQWVNFTIPTFHGAQFTMNLVEMFNRWIQCIKKQKKETEAGDLLPYSFETSIPHSNAIKIIPQLKKPDARMPGVSACKSCFFQENKAKQLNRPHDRPNPKQIPRGQPTSHSMVSCGVHWVGLRLPAMFTSRH